MKLRSLLAPMLGLGGIALGVFLGRGPLADKDASGDRDIAYELQTTGSLLNGASANATGKGSNGTKSGAVGINPANAPQADALLGLINNPNGHAAINRFYGMLGKMPSKDIADLIVDIEDYPNHSRRRETREMIIDYLAMADPMKALEVHKDLPDKGIFGKAFKQLGRSNPAEALRVQASLEDAGDRSSALTSIFVGASEIDPAGAYELLKKTADASPQLYHEVFDNWAEMDPTTAARMALTVKSPAARREALKIVGQEWAERDPQAVLDWVGKTELSSFEREIIKNSAVNAFAKRDPNAAMAMLDDMDSSARNRALPNALSQLIKQDSEAALEWIRNAPDDFAKFRALNENSYNLGREAPEATIALAREIPELQENALSGAFGALASQDLDAALAQAEEWKDSPQYDNIMSQIASSYGRKSPEEALTWANDLEGNARSNAISNVINRLANDDPLLAMKQLDGLGLEADDNVYQNSMQNIASSWAREDPVSAAEWIETLPESNIQTNAIGDVADRWARIDPVSVSEWIGSLDAGPARDQASQRLVNRIQREDPEMAAAWAGSIGDENMRNSALSNVFSQWIRMDPESGNAAMEASALPDEYKQQWRPQVQPPIEFNSAVELNGAFDGVQFGGDPFGN